MNIPIKKLKKALTNNTGSADPVVAPVVAVVILGLIALFHI